MLFEANRFDISITKLSKQDIVLTTYSELIKSLPKPEPETIQDCKDHRKDAAKETLKWSQNHLSNGGLLHQVPWYRVSFDPLQQSHKEDFELS